MKNSVSNKPSDGKFLARFLEMMSAERGAAQNSLAAYGRDLTAYLEFLKGKGVELTFVSTDHVRAFLANAEYLGLARTTAVPILRFSISWGQCSPLRYPVTSRKHTSWPHHVTQKIRIADTWNFCRVLERHKNPLTSANLRREFE